MTKRKTMNPTRFNKVSTAGQKTVDSNQSDVFVQTITFPVVGVASIAEQATGITLPPRCQIVSAVINVFTEETTGVTKTLNVGIAGTPAAIVAAAPVAGIGFNGVGIISNLNGGAEIVYQMGSANFVELVGEAVITIMGTEG